MSNAKTLRASELNAAITTRGWNNAEFWEAKQILDTTPDAEMDRTLILLMNRWSDVESDRIACGGHDPCDPGLDAQLQARWPLNPRG